MEKTWMENEVVLGTYGRASGKRVESYADCDDRSGIFRAEGSVAIKEARDYLVSEMKKIRLEVYYDEVGNLYGRRPGKEGYKAVVSGSHIDTVLNAGQLDGAYGIIAAMEVLRRMDEEDFHNIRPVEVVAFMGEEGSSFHESLLGSSVLSGQRSVQEALSMQTEDGTSLEKIVTTSCSPVIKKDFIRDAEYFIEPHIEQGKVLEDLNVSCGCVYSIVGLCSLMFEIIGEANHAGTTPMRLRKDAGVVAAEMILYANRLARENAQKNGTAVITADTLSVSPNSYSVIPSRASVSFDIRDTTWESIREMREKLIRFASEAAAGYGCTVRSKILSEHVPTDLSPDVQSRILQAAGELGISCKCIPSGAIHDSNNIASAVKTGMLFIKSQGGLSHTPYEWTDWIDQARGIDILEKVLKTLSTEGV